MRNRPTETFLRGAVIRASNPLRREVLLEQRDAWRNRAAIAVAVCACVCALLMWFWADGRSDLEAVHEKQREAVRQHAEYVKGTARVLDGMADDLKAASTEAEAARETIDAAIVALGADPGVDLAAAVAAHLKRDAQGRRRLAACELDERDARKVLEWRTHDLADCRGDQRAADCAARGELDCAKLQAARWDGLRKPGR